MRLPKWLHLACFGLGGFLLLLHALTAFTISGVGGDWLAYYFAGHAVLTHNADNLYNLSLLAQWQAPYLSSGVMPFNNAPVFAAVFVPLASLPIGIARLLWLAVTITAAYGALGVTCRLTGLLLRDSAYALAAFFPLSLALYTGQVSSILLLVFVVLALREWQSRCGYRDGFLAGMILLKPQLLLPLALYWLYRRRWRPLAALSAGGLLVVAGSLLVSVPASPRLLFTPVAGVSDPGRERSSCPAPDGWRIGRPGAWDHRGFGSAWRVVCCVAPPAHSLQSGDALVVAAHRHTLSGPVRPSPGGRPGGLSGTRLARRSADAARRGSGLAESAGVSARLRLGACCVGYRSVVRRLRSAGVVPRTRWLRAGDLAGCSCRARCASRIAAGF